MTLHHSGPAKTSLRLVPPQAFTILELLLTVVLILLLLGAIAFNFSAMSDEAVLREAVGRMETLVHLSRAQAAATGRRVQWAFQRESSPASDPLYRSLWNLAILWEPDPLLRPHYFESLPAASWDVPGLNEHIGVESVVLHDDHSGARLFLSVPPGGLAGDQTAGETNPPPPLLFYPDGSSDSASITLASRSEQDHRRFRLNLDGMTGTIRSGAIENSVAPSQGLPSAIP